MTNQFTIDQAVITDFDRALSTGQRHHRISRLIGRNNELLSYSDLLKQHGLKGQRYLGAQTVLLDRIVGSLGRSKDFDRDFYPLRYFSSHRWRSIARAAYMDVGLPAVELYKVGDSYYVRDGHHRISVARTRGQVYIDAQVIEADLQYLPSGTEVLKEKPEKPPITTQTPAAAIRWLRQVFASLINVVTSWKYRVRRYLQGCGPQSQREDCYCLSY